MPEETTNTAAESTETAQTAPTTGDATPAATTTTEPAKESAEAKSEPAAAEKQEPAKAEEYTLDSYKDLLDAETMAAYEVTEESLANFKELGLKNHISPEALKAVAKWSFDNIKAQKEQEERIKEGWRKQNQEKYGENLKNVKTNVGRVLADMDKSGQFASLLQLVGAEEHPATLEFLSAIGDVLLEKGSVNPNASVQGKDLSLEYMYRNNK